MEGIDPLGVVAGIVLVVGGIVLLGIGMFIWPLLIYGVIVLIVGLAILFSLRKQEQIEQIKEQKIKRRKS